MAHLTTKRRIATLLLVALLPLTAMQAQDAPNEDGKQLNTEKMESKDYLPEIHGTIRSNTNTRQP